MNAYDFHLFVLGLSLKLRCGTLGVSQCDRGSNLPALPKRSRGSESFFLSELIISPHLQRRAAWPSAGLQCMSQNRRGGLPVLQEPLLAGSPPALGPRAQTASICGARVKCRCRSHEVSAGVGWELTGYSAHRPCAVSTYLPSSRRMYGMALMASVLIYSSCMHIAMWGQPCAGGHCRQPFNHQTKLWHCMSTPTGGVQSPD